MTALFSLEQVGVQWPRSARPALQQLSLQIRAGERVALIGANGCGKSTLLRLLHGLQPASQGQLQLPNGRLRQAMVFQRPYLLRMSALANVALGLWLGGLAWRPARERALGALQRVGMAAQASHPAHKLSAGQQQRVAMARAWALAPTVLFLDEPTSSLDPHAKREVEHLIEQFTQQDPAMTLVFASHNLGQVKRLASRVLYLEQGRLLADLPVQDFFGGTLLQQHYAAAHQFVKGGLP